MTRSAGTSNEGCHDRAATWPAKRRTGGAAIRSTLTEHGPRAADPPALDRLACIVSALPAAVVQVGADARIEAWQGAAERLLGWRAAEALGLSFSTVLADGRGELTRILARALAGIATEAEDVELQLRTGEPMLVRVSAAPRVDSAGEPAGAVVVLVDVTGERLANERLAYQAQLLASVGEAIMAVDERLAVTAWNHAAEEIYGWRADEVVGRPVHQVLRTELPDGDLAGMIRDLHESGRFRGAVRQRHRSGRELAIEITARALRSETGRLSGFVFVSRDATARHEAEEARAKAEADLRQAQKLDALGQLAAGVAHDFNNLLTAIQGYGELLVNRLGATGDREDAAEIVRAAERGAGLTRQLLAFSRRERPEPTRLDLSELVAGMESLLRRTLEERVELRLRLPRGLPPVLADRGQLEQVLLNLAVNARDAMPGGGTLTVRTDAVHDGGQRAGVRLRVTDTGTGMPPEVVARAFEPFFTTKEPGRGTGLGLATVWGIVRDVGGTVSIDSGGNGTTVTVVLPTVAGAAGEPVADEPPADDTKGSPATILVVEDEDTVRTLSVRLLGELGYTVLEAPDAEQALALVENEGPIDLLLTDVMLPGANGLELARALRERLPDLRVVTMSGYACREALEDTGDGVPLLAKPFRRDALLGRVREALDPAPSAPAAYRPR